MGAIEATLCLPMNRYSTLSPSSLGRGSCDLHTAVHHRTHQLDLHHVPIKHVLRSTRVGGHKLTGYRPELLLVRACFEVNRAHLWRVKAQECTYGVSLLFGLWRSSQVHPEPPAQRLTALDLIDVVRTWPWGLKALEGIPFPLAVWVVAFVATPCSAFNFLGPSRSLSGLALGDIRLWSAYRLNLY